MVNDLIQGFDEEVFCAFLNGQFSASLSRRVVNLGGNEEFAWESARQVGVVKTLLGSKGENRPLLVVCAKLREGEVLTERSSRIKQFTFAKQVLDEAMAAPAPGVEGLLSQGLFAFHDEQGNFRLSLVYGQADGTKLVWSTAKRLSFYVEAEKPNKTFRDRAALGWSSFDKLKEAFSVEKLTKEFYTRLYGWYQRAMDSDGVVFPNDLVKDKEPGEVKSEQTIRLITRLMFVWFLKQKHLVPHDLFDPKRLAEILKDFDPANGESYYRAILQNLFFATLNTEIPERAFAIEGSRQENEEHFGVKIFYRYAAEFEISEEEVIRLFRSIPFMNGGLFECLDRDNLYYDGFSRRKGKQARVPNALFFDENGLIPLLSQYNFTVEENSPGDEEVALDPEMLGKVFENLLAAYNPETNTQARKATGSFYTPREIVNYMVDESLIAHLGTKCGEEHAEPIRRLFREGERPADETLCAAMDQALVTAKILDPACGSGAFPMGILLRMVELLRILRRVPEGQSVYALKLELIKNCIYGGDIQCIAVQISKLRFFISLVCEQKPTADAKENYGIHTLPNLETKFVAADSLIGLPKDGKDVLDLCTGEIADLKNELFEVRLRHFSARSYQEKKELRKDDRALRAKIKKTVKRDTEPDRSKLELLKKEREKVAEPKWVRLAPKMEQGALFGDFSENGDRAELQIDENEAKRKRIDAEIAKEEQKVSLPTTVVDEIADMLASWDPYDQNASAKFSDPEWMFNVKDGFDVVIGNPPYVDVKALDKERTSKLFSHFSTATNRINLYSLFIEKGFYLSSKTGNLCFINPNSMLIGTSYTKLRKLILDDLYLVLKLPDGIFEAATVETIILMLNKNSSCNTIQSKWFANFEDMNLLNINYSVFDKMTWKLDAESRFNIFISTQTTELLQKIQESSVLLEAIADFSLGITPYDKAKGHSKNLINSRAFHSKSKKSNDYVPLIAGANVCRYIVNGTSPEFLLYSDKLGAPRQRRFFTEEKIIIRQILASNPVSLIAAYSNSDHYFTQIGFSILVREKNKISTKSLIAFINSKLINFYHTNKFLDPEKIVFPKILIENCKKFPIKLPDNPLTFDNIVTEILDRKKSDPAADTTGLEAEIDQLVYKLYELTEEEIKIVEGTTAASAKPAKIDSKTSEPKTVESAKAKSARKAQPKLPPSLPGWD